MSEQQTPPASPIVRTRRVRTSGPTGVASDPTTGRPLLYDDIPVTVRETLRWLVFCKLFTGEYDPLTKEMLFVNVSRYYGRPVLRPKSSTRGYATREERRAARDLTKRQWKSWQLQRVVPGTRANYQGRYAESVLAALVNAASIVDPRIATSESALAWTHWIRTHVDTWLSDPLVVDGLARQTAYVAVPSRRKRSHGHTLEDEALLASGWVAPTPRYV